MKRFGAFLLICLALPASADAARVELRPAAVAGENELAYTAGADEVNHVYMYRRTGFQGGGLVWDITDAGAPPIDRVSPCVTSLNVAWVSECPDDHVSSILVDLGDRDDEAPAAFSMIHIPVTVRGGLGRDRIWTHSDGGNLLDGGPGNDVITSERLGGSTSTHRGGADIVTAGEGDDEVHTRDAARDTVYCGPGRDEVFADDLDTVGADCENVTLPYQPPPSVPFDLWKRSDGEPVGVTINDAARYTNDRDVILTVRHPPVAATILISNDGGFAKWVERPPRDSERYGFRLSSADPDRLPRTVYVRFDLDLTRTFRDDIVLDQRRPTVATARLAGRTRGGRVRVSLKARDWTSGVRSAQFAQVRNRPWRSVKFHRRLTVRRVPDWVRVRDRAGNLSHWNRVAPG